MSRRRRPASCSCLTAVISRLYCSLRLSGTCQVIPMFAIYTFGPQIVGLLGWEQGRNAALGNVVISLFFMLGCIPAMFWLNSIGRRPLLIGSFAMMTIALALLGLVSNLGIILVVVAFAVYAFFSGQRAYCNGFILMNSSLRIFALRPWGSSCH
ncbi:MFS transporter [Salmonella enterica subsp. enterica serovar Infantis]